MTIKVFTLYIQSQKSLLWIFMSFHAIHINVNPMLTDCMTCHTRFQGNETRERARERALSTAIVFSENPLSLRERQNLKIS